MGLPVEPDATSGIEIVRSLGNDNSANSLVERNGQIEIEMERNGQIQSVDKDQE